MGGKAGEEVGGEPGRGGDYASPFVAAASNLAAAPRWCQVPPRGEAGREGRREGEGLRERKKREREKKLGVSQLRLKKKRKLFKWMIGDFGAARALSVCRLHSTARARDEVIVEGIERRFREVQGEWKARVLEEHNSTGALGLEPQIESRAFPRAFSASLR